MNITATIIEHAQGSEGWLQHRARSLNASELGAVMGLSSYQTRADILKQKATGLTPEVDAATQRRFDAGHEFEAMARVWAEEIIGEDLYPVVLAADVDGLHLSASLDGQAIGSGVTWEHKSGRADLLASLEAGVIPDEYHPQMEQGLMLAGADRCLFMASSGNRETMRCAWYESKPELRAKIIPTWKQFVEDVSAYVPTAAELPKPTGRAPETLPSLRIEVTGMVTASNLDEFKSQALAVFQGINRDLKTDADFADAEATVKWAKGIEDRLGAAKEAALAQTETIDRLFKAIDDISAEARRVRLDLDKLVKARKDALRSDIVVAGQTALAKYIRELNAAMPGDYMPQVPADFAGAIKGMKSLDSIKNAVDTELARAKVAASEIANRIHANVKALKDSGLVVHDAAALVLKQPDDLAAVLAQRLATEREREERARERLRQEHEAQIAREAAARAMAKQVVAVAAAPVVARPAPVEVDTGERLNLSQINARLAPLTITAAGLAELGFEPVETVKASKLFRASDFERMCSVLVLHIRGVAALA